MTSILFPSLPQCGFYSFRPTNFTTNQISHINSPVQIGSQVRRSAMEESATGDYSPIQIWDVAKDRLVVSHPTNYPIIEAKTAEVEGCLKAVLEVDGLFRRYYKTPPLQNNRHLMKVYLNEPHLAPNNAYWDPKTDSVLVDGTISEHYSPPAMIPEIIAHEFGHGFIHYHSPLPASSQSGSLNESFADIIAIMTKHFHTQAQADNPDTNWEVGVGFLKGATGGSALRSLKNPGRAFEFHPIEGTDEQISHMSCYGQLIANDSKDSHKCAGIPSHAFYRSAFEIGGGSWEKAGCIWLGTLLNTSYTDQFSDFACRTMATVKALNYGPHVYEAVGRAWLEVGVDLRKYAYKIYDVESLTVKNLEDSMYYFGAQDFHRGLYSFDQACARAPDAITSVYRNAWSQRGSPQNAHRYGEYCFRGHYHYIPDCYLNCKAVEKYKNAVLNYETTSYFTPSQTNLLQCLEKSLQNKAIHTLISSTEGLKLICRTLHLDFFGFR